MKENNELDFKIAQILGLTPERHESTDADGKPYTYYMSAENPGEPVDYGMYYFSQDDGIALTYVLPWFKQKLALREYSYGDSILFEFMPGDAGNDTWEVTVSEHINCCQLGSIERHERKDLSDYEKVYRGRGKSLAEALCNYVIIYLEALAHGEFKEGPEGRELRQR